MLIAENLVKTFEKNEKKGRKVSFNAVDNVSLEAGKGEIIGILGPNGAGKTTLLRMLGGLLDPSSGSVGIDVGDGIITDKLQLKANIGYLSNNTKLYGRLSTREILKLVGNIYGMSDEQIRDKTDELTEMLKLSEFIDNRIEKLSTGQTQRASIARCLIHNPGVYIFDEPTLGLDIMSADAIIEFMKNEKEKGKTVIYSTHYMEEAEYLCDKLIILSHGRIIANGTVAEIISESGENELRSAFKKKLQVEL